MMSSSPEPAIEGPDAIHQIAALLVEAAEHRLSASLKDEDTTP
jgi:hypothetical protein